MSKDKKKSGGTGGMSRGTPPSSPKGSAVPRGAARLQGGERMAPLWARVFVWCIWAAAGVLALWALVLTSGQTAEINRFSEQGWGQYAPAIIGNRMRALWHAAFMTAVVGFALWWMVLRKGGGGGRWKVEGGRRAEDGGQRSERADQNVEVCGLRSVVCGPVVPLILVLIVALDAWWLSRNYVKTMPRSALDANPVIAILKQDTPEHRVALVSQDGFYNSWLTFLFPYHGILTVNVTQMPRMPEDYKNFLGAVGRHPLRLWQLSAVGHVLAPAQVWQQIRHDPAWSNAFELVYGYNVGPSEAGVSVIPVWSGKRTEVRGQRSEVGGEKSEVRGQRSEVGGRRSEVGGRRSEVEAPPPADVGQHVVLRLIRPAPRLALIGAAREVADDEALKLLGSLAYELFREVLVAAPEVRSQKSEVRGQKSEVRGQKSGGGNVEWGGLTNAGLVGACTLLHYRPGRMEIAVQADKDGILRVSEKYDRAWKATVDGIPVLVQRVDYIMQGVPVPAGQHKVLLWYSPTIWPLYLQGAGLLIVLGAGAWLVVGWFRGRRIVNSGQ
jgi:hypothetical protein